MNEKTAQRRAYYLSKIKQAEMVMLKTANAGTLHDMEMVVANTSAYRAWQQRLARMAAAVAAMAEAEVAALPEGEQPPRVANADEPAAAF